MNGNPGVRPQVWLVLTLSMVLLLASLGVREMRRERGRWLRGREQSQTLQRLAATQESERRELLTRLENPAATLQELVDAYLPGSQVEVREADAELLASGFRLRRGELKFSALDWNALRTWMEKAESRTTPWRVTALNIERRLDGLSGSLRVEALDKALSAP